MSKISTYTCIWGKHIYLHVHFEAMSGFYGIMTNDTYMYSESSQRLETKNQPFYLIKSVFLGQNSRWYYNIGRWTNLRCPCIQKYFLGS